MLRRPFFKDEGRPEGFGLQSMKLPRGQLSYETLVYEQESKTAVGQESCGSVLEIHWALPTGVRIPSVSYCAFQSLRAVPATAFGLWLWYSLPFRQANLNFHWGSRKGCGIFAKQPAGSIKGRADSACASLNRKSMANERGGVYFSFLFFLFGSLLASWLFGFLAFWLFVFLLVYAAFGGFLALAFRILCIPSSSSAGGVLAFAFYAASPPNPPLLSRFLAEIELHPYLNHHFFERPNSRENAAKYDLWVICVIHVCLYVCTSSKIIWEATPANPPSAPFLE